jgi:hypothetical protein
MARGQWNKKYKEKVKLHTPCFPLSESDFLERGIRNKLYNFQKELLLGNFTHPLFPPLIEVIS